MFDLAFAEIVQKWAPVAILREIIGNVLAEQNVARITAIHHALRDVNASARNVTAIIHVLDGIDRTTVNTHA